MQNYKDLEIYKISHKLAIDIHKFTIEELPKFEMFEEGNQIRRSAKSIPSNIVEGFGKKCYQQEYIKYLTNAIASCEETKEHLELLFDSGSLKNEEKFNLLMNEYNILGKKLYLFRKKIIEDLKA